MVKMSDSEMANWVTNYNPEGGERKKGLKLGLMWITWERGELKTGEYKLRIALDCGGC
jgi:hypothetical protein